MDLITWPIHVLERKGDLSYCEDLELLRWPVGFGTGQKTLKHKPPSKSRAKSREITPVEGFTASLSLHLHFLKGVLFGREIFLKLIP